MFPNLHQAPAIVGGAYYDERLRGLPKVQTITNKYIELDKFLWHLMTKENLNLATFNPPSSGEERFRAPDVRLCQEMLAQPTAGAARFFAPLDLAESKMGLLEHLFEREFFVLFVAALRGRAKVLNIDIRAQDMTRLGLARVLGWVFEFVGERVAWCRERTLRISSFVVVCGLLGWAVGFWIEFGGVEVSYFFSCDLLLFF